MGRPALDLAASDIDGLPLTIDLSYSAPGDRIQVALSEEAEDAIRGMLCMFDARPRRVLVALLNGLSRRQAANRVPIHENTLDSWIKKDKDFAEAVRMCTQLGTAELYEAELQSIALDRSHKGQVRALELVAKARIPEYREKHQMTLEVLHRAAESWSGFLPAAADANDVQHASE